MRICNCGNGDANNYCEECGNSVCSDCWWGYDDKLGCNVCCNCHEEMVLKKETYLTCMGNIANGLRYHLDRLQNVLVITKGCNDLLVKEWDSDIEGAKKSLYDNADKHINRIRELIFAGTDLLAHRADFIDEDTDTIDFLDTAITDAETFLRENVYAKTKKG